MTASRIELANDRPLREDGRWVLYWMTSARRTGWNFGLERAAMQAAELGKPLVVLEAFRCDYRHASERLHAFALQGMADNARACEAAGVLYYPYVEPRPGAGSWTPWPGSPAASWAIASRPGSCAGWCPLPWRA
jgi:deoxyribodipyrimidine photo-lyase